MAEITDADFMLRILSDGKPHSTMQIIERSMQERGCGLTPHSRAANLRERGHVIHCIRQESNGAFTYRQKPTYFYRLAGLNEGGAGGVAEGAQPSSTSYPPSLNPEPTPLDERPEAGEGLAAPSRSDGTGRSSSGARSPDGAHPTDGSRQESSSPRTAVSPLSRPSTTSTASLAAGESEMRPLFDLPNEPAWA